MYAEKLQLTTINHKPIRHVINDTVVTEGRAGFLRNDSSCVWIKHESTLEILSIETGARVSHYNFARHGSCFISRVEEIDYYPNISLLAVTTENTADLGGGILSIFCVQGSKILGSLDLPERITCCRYIEQSACQRSVLSEFHGTVAIGTDQGKLFLLDLMLPSIHDIASAPSFELDLFPCINELADQEQSQIARIHREISSGNTSTSARTFFTIQLDVLNDSGPISAILCMTNLFSMAVGLADGRMVLYDLRDLQAFHLAYPPNNRAPIIHMSFLEPNDDPRCAVYIWAFHSSNNGAIACMHSLMYSRKVDQVYEDFKSCSVRLTMPIYDKDSFPICSRSIMRNVTQEDEDVLTLNVLSWTSTTSKKTRIMIFDLNQWYKEEMPNVGDWRLKLKYAAVFELQNCRSLDVIINENSVFPFNSVERPEEHFYPNSLSFDVCVIEGDKISRHRWFGLQNIVLQQFNVIGPQIIVEPSFYYNELLQAAICPQFSDAFFNMATPLGEKREYLLSVALEYNFNGFLRKCALAWSDGSNIGRDNPNSLGLSTLTDWIWNRACAIKNVCNELCQSLFDYSSQRIDYGTQKQLSQCCKQLKTLSDLLLVVLRDFKQFIPENIVTQLKSQSENIQMASEYQEILQWLLNVGLLPEGNDERHNDMNDFMEDDFLIVPYPYYKISSFYKTQRLKLMTGSVCKADSSFLFIDEFIRRECCEDKLREIWGVNYPPRSMQALLRTLLISEISLQNKHVIFVYIFMDITKVLNEEIYASIVRNLIKFPAVFKMNPALIKRTQAFWNLDNGNLETAVEELISPLSNDKPINLWQRELLIAALLKQNANSLALRALRCPGNHIISSYLEMITLLCNNLISEALKVQRASGNRNLLETLFENILHSEIYEQLLELSLTGAEGAVLTEYLNSLKNTGLPTHLNLHFVYLLQRSKFLDAAQLVESLGVEDNINTEPPKQMLNAYYSSMESTTRKLTSTVYRDDAQISTSPMPLSVNLLQAKCNARNNIFHQCISSISEAALENITNNDNNNLPFIGSPKLGIFEYKQNTVNSQEISFSHEVNEHGKRKQTILKDKPLFEDLEAPHQKKRRLNDSIAIKNRSFADNTMRSITTFKETKANYSFSTRNANKSPRTPERVHVFNAILNTPLVQKKTPPRKTFECPSTPHSILKTRSCRGSVSPAPSRVSEYGDDNKSVKSITFAALPGSRDESLNDSTLMEEESFEVKSSEVSNEKFYSPERLSFEGPRARKPLKSRSTTPIEAHSSNTEAPDVGRVEDVETHNVESEVQTEDHRADELMDTSGDISDGEVLEPFRVRNILKDYSSDDSSDEQNRSIAENSIYDYERKSVLPSEYSDSSSSDEVREKEDDTSSEDSEKDGHEFSEEDSSDNEADYGDIDLNDSDSQSQHPELPTASDEIICLDSSDDDVVEEEVTPNLPSFTVLTNVENEILSDDADSENPLNVAQALDEPLVENEILSDDAETEIQEVASATAPQDAVLPRVIELQSSEEAGDLVVEEVIQEEVQPEPDSTSQVAIESEGKLLVFYEMINVDELQVADTEDKVAQEVVEQFIVEEVVKTTTEGIQEEAQMEVEIQEEARMEEEILIPEKNQVAQKQEETEDKSTKEETATISQNMETTATSIMSEESAFLSATDDALNEAVVMQSSSNEALDDTHENSANTSQDSENPLNVAQALDEQGSLLLSPPKEPAKPESPMIQITERDFRAQSVPHEPIAKTRSSRAQTEDRENPTKKLRSRDLDRIEIVPSPLPSPGVLTRRRSQLLEAGESSPAPLTPKRSSRRNSTLSESSEQPLTPRRITRSTSKDSLASKPETTEQPKRAPSLRNVRSVDTSEDENDDASSSGRTRTTRKATLPVSQDKVDTSEELSVSNRRLTRHQLQMLEKSQKLSKEKETGGSLRATRSENTISTSKVDDSDNESVKSGKSVTSSRTSRKRPAPKKSKDDSSSVASKYSRRSASPKWGKLSIIPEESGEGSSVAGSTSRSERSKSSKRH